MTGPARAHDNSCRTGRSIRRAVSGSAPAGVGSPASSHERSRPCPPDPDAISHLAGRVEALETTCAYQEQVIEDLNALVIELSGKLQSVTRQIASFEDRLRDLQDRTPQDPQDEPPPPHY